MTTQAQRESVIEGWMTTIVRDGGVERYDDLHIDQIYPQWASREHWLEGGLEAYRTARRIRDRQTPDSTVVLAFSLQSGERQIGLNFRTRKELQAQLDWSPPSLYVFRPKCEPWTQIGAEPVPVDCVALFEATLETKGCYYFEFRQPGSAEYSRSLVVAG